MDENIEAKLLLNNKGNEPIEVQPTLYNKQGQQLQLPPVTVEPQNFRFINLNDWVIIGGESFKSGNIKLFHYGKDLVLGAQIYLTDEVRSLSYEEKLAEKGKFDSRRQEAVWWMPSNSADVKIVLTNTTNAVLSVAGKLAKKPNHVSNAQTFELPANQTKVLDLREDFADGNQFANAEILALSLEHSGAKDALLARVMIAEPQRGYSNIAQFSNPAGGKSSEYQGVGFQIEDIANQEFEPVIAARNVGTQTATVNVKVPYTRANGTRGNITLPIEQLSSGEMRLIKVQNIIQRVRNEQIKIASLEVEYNTAPGSVIVAAHSVSQNHNQVFRVPMWDPFGQRSPTGGYPWLIEGTSKTETYIKNISEQAQDYVAFLVWENGGMYMIGLKPIAAHETVHIDVKKLRDEQIPDERGRLIPLNLSSGQLQWTLRRKDTLPDDDVRANLALIGRSEQVDLTKGIVNNYACQNCCTGDFISGRIVAADLSQEGQPIEVGSSRNYFAVERQQTCYGLPYEFTYQDVGIYNAVWTSSNYNVANVIQGNVTGVGEGQAEIRASWYPYTVISTPCSPQGGGNPLISGEENCEESERNKENFEDDTTISNIAQCGTCQRRRWSNPYTAVKYVTVPPPPTFTLNVPSTANDGNTVTFSITPQNGTVTGVQWEFTAPNGAGNNPQVNFSAPTSATTTARAHWFALPNDPCTAAGVANYQITATVTFDGGSQQSKSKNMAVNGFWNPGGETAEPSITGSPAIDYDPMRGVYYVSGIGTITRNPTPPVIYVPVTSQFRNKVVVHENRHDQQWRTGMLSDILQPTSLLQVIANFTNASRPALVQQINAALQPWKDGQELIYIARRNAAEIDAYDVSDPIAPMYLYQRCGRTEFPLFASKEGEWLIAF